ncbi:hypothetical protein BDZ45DRAFT_600882 [Acephala macrosclerotiorum]|nr:hypothetical protein BDZ45DRAFT_600882 [Acephala macrosclerotiorum]
MRVPEIHRFALVWVFLRTLEHYQGPRNNVKQIDDAIASRIRFKSKYNKLSLEQRSTTWRRFL